jgi:hypothetical protein
MKIENKVLEFIAEKKLDLVYHNITHMVKFNKQMYMFFKPEFFEEHTLDLLPEINIIIKHFDIHINLFDSDLASVYKAKKIVTPFHAC